MNKEHFHILGGKRHWWATTGLFLSAFDYCNTVHVTFFFTVFNLLLLSAGNRTQTNSS
jgi:hypothetical protein